MSTSAETSVSWLGLTVDGYKIDEELSSGRFNKVYLGVNASGAKRVFKVARSQSEISDEVALTESCGILLMTGSFTGVRPNVNELLKLEFKKYALVSAFVIPKGIELTTNKTARTFLTMDYVQGESLRSLIHRQKADLSLMISVAEAVKALLTSELEHHGDLKPENICITQNGPCIFDPGHFGPLVTEHGNLDSCVVTTPLYYPSLNPLDLSAFGFMLWEALLQVHPLSGPQSSSPRASEQLLQYLQLASMKGARLLNALASVRQPRELQPGLAPELETLLLRTIGLTIDDDGKLTTTKPYADFAELVADLKKFS